MINDELRAVAEQREYYRERSEVAERDLAAAEAALAEEREARAADRDAAAEAWTRLDAAYQQELERADEVRHSNAALVEELDGERERADRLRRAVVAARPWFALATIQSDGLSPGEVALNELDAAVKAASPPAPTEGKEGTGAHDAPRYRRSKSAAPQAVSACCVALATPGASVIGENAMPDHPADAAAPELGELERLAKLLLELATNGPGVADVQTIAHWLLAHGLTVARAPAQSNLSAQEYDALVRDAMRWRAQCDAPSEGSPGSSVSPVRRAMPSESGPASPAASPSTPSTESGSYLRDWCDRHQRFYAVNDCPECAPLGRREPSEAAWKAAVDAATPGLPGEVQGNIETVVDAALRAAYAADFPSALESA